MRGVVLSLLFSFFGYSLFATPPAHYVENRNQWPAGFHYGAEFQGARVFLKDRSLYFIQYHQSSSDDKTARPLLTGFREDHVHGAGELSLTTFELEFLNALHPAITASEQQTTIYNYYLGNDPSGWGQGAHAYGEVLYKGMYDGIDVRIYSEGESMKYDWIVSPCADPGRIAFAYKGIEHLDLVDGNLVVKSKLGEMIETRPFAYQVVNGERRVVPAAFEIDNGSVSFVFPEGYDLDYELVIDPALIFSSYSGSTLDNWGNSATPDSRGNLYSGGMVSTSFGQTGFPTTAGSFQAIHHQGVWDVGILKYDSSGARVLYATYLGGNGADTPQSLVVNGQDELLILGVTSSTNFPGTSTGTFKGGPQVVPLPGVDFTNGTDLFIARLSRLGTRLIASTYLGGTANDGINFVGGNMGSPVSKIESPVSKNYGDQLRGDIITDAEGFVYIASNTRSANFPLVNADPDASWHGGTHDAVVAKLTPNLSVVWSRLMGGSNTDTALSIKIASSGNIFVAGGTTSTNLAGMNGLHATAPGGIDGWIAELSPAGNQVLNGTYVGTVAYDQVYFIDLAVNGDVLAYGQTQGRYPVQPAEKVYSNKDAGQFVHRFTPDLKQTVFSTTFGKGGLSPDISPTAFLVNNCDHIFMAGWGGTTNTPVVQAGANVLVRNYVGGDTFGLPVTPDAWQPTTVVGNDFYFIVLNADASELLYATFLGGSSTATSTHVDGGTSRFDKSGVVYHAVCASCGGRPRDFPSYNVPESRSENRSSNCNNAAFKFDLASLRAGMRVPDRLRVCLPEPAIFINTSLGGETYEWNFGDGPTQTFTEKVTITHRYKTPGIYKVTLKAIDESTCITADSVAAVINVYQPDMQVGPDQKICEGSSVQLSTSGGAAYVWKTAENTLVSVLPAPVVAPPETTTYFLDMRDINGCQMKDTVTVNVVPGFDLAFDTRLSYDCQSRPYLKVKKVSELDDGEEAIFSFGDGASASEPEAIHNYDQDGVYTVSLRATRDFCVFEESKDVRIATLKMPNVITPGEEDTLNDVLKVVYGDTPGAKEGLEFGLKIMDRWGVTVFETNDYRDDWTGHDVAAGVYFYELKFLGEVQCKGWIHLLKAP